MFNFPNLCIDNDTHTPENFNIVINGRVFPCVRWIAFRVSKVICNYLQKNPKEEQFNLQIDEYGDMNMIHDILRGRSIKFTSSSIPFLLHVASILEIDTLIDELTSIQNKMDDMDDLIHSNSDLNRLISIEKLFLYYKRKCAYKPTKSFKKYFQKVEGVIEKVVKYFVKHLIYLN